MSAPEWLRTWRGARVDHPLSRVSQYGIGGPADVFIAVDDGGTVADLVARCYRDGVPVTLLGAGSNALILDGGVRGLVLRFAARVMRVCSAEAIELAGGCMMPRAALDCARLGIAGFEFGIGIPGTCGASVWGNAGAFGTEVADVLIDCDVVRRDGSQQTLAAADCGFTYRASRFKEEPAPTVIVAARFRVHPGDPTAVRAATDAIQTRRKATQPYGIRSLGSVFKNPPGDHAGRLIEAAGLKGARCGGAEISTKHANFIVNADGASAADVLGLVELAQRTVQDRYGVALEREIVLLGEQP